MFDCLHTLKILNMSKKKGKVQYPIKEFFAYSGIFYFSSVKSQWQNFSIFFFFSKILKDFIFKRKHLGHQVNQRKSFYDPERNFCHGKEVFAKKFLLQSILSKRFNCKNIWRGNETFFVFENFFRKTNWFWGHKNFSDDQSDAQDASVWK